MSSGSLRELTKAISKAAPELSLPLPTSLLEVITAYLERHSSDDDLESINLQDELLAIYQSKITQYPSRLAAFLAILQLLKPLFPKTRRLLQWWDQLLNPILTHIGIQPKLADETRDILLEILVYDEDANDGKKLENAKANSFSVADILLASWLTKYKQADEEFNEHAGYVAGHIQLILIEYGKKRPKDFLIILNKFFVQPESRILSLSLLCSFFRHPPPHLHQMLLTPLFVNLLRCLQFDTSTRAVSLAMTALVMFLPHIPCTTSQHLPALFNIYTRMLFWDRVRRAEDKLLSEVKEVGTDLNESDWTKLPHLLNSNDESVPELLHYFTFLYGLYPINFMSYIHKPQKYFNIAYNLEAELDIHPIDIRQRSEPFRQVHLLHPNFFTFTIESELSDDNRWIKSDAADVVAECMALYIPSEDFNDKFSLSKAIKTDSDITSRFLNDDETTLSQTGWHEFQASDQYRNLSGPKKRISQPLPPLDSVQDPTEVKSSERSNSPNFIPPDTHSTSSQCNLNINASSPIIFQKDNMLKSIQNVSVASLALSNYHESQIDNLPSSINHDISPSSFSYTKPIEPLTSDMRVAYLYREIQLLRNVLNFERYLKQQHLSHIGKLRRKQIREARIEAETQNIFTSNRYLKLKLEESKRLITQLRSEREKSKNHWHQWEAELSTKLRSLREEQKNWATERLNMKKEINAIKENETILRQIIIKLEADELKEKQKAAHVQSHLEELERLRAEVEVLESRVREYEVEEQAAKASKDNENMKEAQIIMLEAQLKSRDQELRDARKLFHEEVVNNRKQLKNNNIAPKFENYAFQEMIDGALAFSRTRTIELQKSYNQLFARYSALQDKFYGLQDERDEPVKVSEVFSPGPHRGSNSFHLNHGTS